MLVPHGKLMCLLPDEKFSHPCCYLQHLSHPFRTSLSYHSLICPTLDHPSDIYGCSIPIGWSQFSHHSSSAPYLWNIPSLWWMWPMMPTSFRLSFWAPTIILLSIPTNILNFLHQFHIHHQEHQWTLSTALFWKPISTDHLGNFHFPTTLTTLQNSLPGYLFCTISQCLNISAGIFQGALWWNLKVSKRGTFLDWEVLRCERLLLKEWVAWEGTLSAMIFMKLAAFWPGATWPLS